MFEPMNLRPLIACSALLALPAHAAVDDFRFQPKVLATGFVQPMELEVAADGRIFVNELNGALKIIKPATGETLLAGELKVFNQQENGFLGFALDPQFAQNNRIYLFYSPPDYTGSRLSRFVMKGDQLDRASEKVILEFPEQRLECCHHAGSVEFGPDGLLFISTGDNTHPGGDSDGYAPIDERPGRAPYDAQKSSANTHDLRGKILRLKLREDGSYEIPDGNLFSKDGSKGRPEIFVMGCRNPWRISVDQKSGFVYWGDVGPDAGGDGARGTRGYDELNQARTAGNFGWPYFVGHNFPYRDYDFSAKTVGPVFDAASPTNSSPNNTGAGVLPPAQPAFIYWPYGDSKEFPVLGGGGRTACAGPVFHFDPHFKDTGGFPAEFDNSLLFFDWQRPFIKWARLASNGDLKAIESFADTVVVANDRDRVKAAREQNRFVIQRPIDAQFGQDGCLYLLDYGETWGANPDAQLIKISYQWGNLAPIAKVAADKNSGREPLAVKLSARVGQPDGSFDHEKDPLTFNWILHPGGKLFSTEESPTLRVEQPGNYLVELRLSDPHGGASSASLPLVVGNTSPEISFISPRDGDFFTPGEPLAFKVSVRDHEDGNSEDQDELFESKVFVSGTWSRGDGRTSESDPGLAAIKQSDCLNCHAPEQKIVGPAFLEIAQKYRGQEGALEASVQRVIKGSSGEWGEVPMLPHESLNPDQVRMMVRWILALEPGKAGANMIRGLTGNTTTPKDEKLAQGFLEATYTDNGRAPAGSLTSKARVQLRPRRLQAEAAEEKQGLKILGYFVGSIDHGHALRFANINLAQASAAKLRVSSAGTGGKIQLRATALDGPLLAELEVQPTGGWEKWIELTAPIKAATREDLFVVFVNPGKGGLMNLDWLELLP